jgi:hypothetical protein
MALVIEKGQDTDWNITLGQQAFDRLLESLSFTYHEGDGIRTISLTIANDFLVQDAYLDGIGIDGLVNLQRLVDARIHDLARRSIEEDSDSPESG